MKTKLLVMLVGISFSFTCYSQHSTREEPIQTRIDCAEIFHDSIFCRFSTSPWIDSFSTAFNIDTVVVTFDSSYVNSMYTMYGDSTFVRIYFTLPSDTGMQLPGAVIVPVSTKRCHEDITTNVLTATRLHLPGHLGPISEATKMEMGYYRTVADSLKNSDTINPIYGYNFTWRHIMEACRWGKVPLGIAYGLSNVDRDGSDSLEIHMFLTEGVHHMDNRLFLDFSEPCPKLCGSLIPQGGRQIAGEIKEEE